MVEIAESLFFLSEGSEDRAEVTEVINRKEKITMKCPYRTVNKNCKNIYDPHYGRKINEIRESFPDCYEEDCPLYVDGECVRVRDEKGDYYE